MGKFKLTSPEKASDILARALRTLVSEGDQVIYNEHERFEVYAAALTELISLPQNWHPTERTSRVSKALIAAKRKNVDLLDDYIELLESACSELLEAPERDYHLWTRVNLRNKDLASAVAFSLEDSIIVRFARNPPSGLKFDGDNKNACNAAYLEGGIVASARGRFRSNLQAGDGLYGAISDVVALINVAEHRRRRTWYSGEARPKATLLIGKYNFLFQGNLDVNKDGQWYNPDFRDDFWNRWTFTCEKLRNATPYVRIFLKGLKSNVSREPIMRAVRLLHEGWQGHERHQGLLRSWSAFEALLSRSNLRTDDYDKVVDRACFFARDREYVKAAFDVARNYRNRFVHRAESSGAVDSVATFLDEYLIGVIEGLLSMPIKFESHIRLLDAMDLTPDMVVLKRQILDRQRALKLRGHR
jgi:hypothetical protein